jgi:hypothetical protein
MRRSLAAAMAAITFGGVVATTAAEAQPYRGHRGDYYGGRRHNNNDAGVAIAAGVVGLALGAAIAGSNNSRGGYYNQGYGRSYAPGYSQGYGRSYAPGYAYSQGYGYGPSYGYAPQYRVCQSRERVYDPYTDRRVTIRREYAC